MIHKTTDDKIKELGKCIEQTEGYKQRFLDTNNPREATLIGIKVAQLKEELKGSYTESTQLFEVQSMIRKEIEPLNDKALSITKELCRIYREVGFRNTECYDCPLSIIGNDGDDDKCFSALKRHLICQYLTTEFHV